MTCEDKIIKKKYMHLHNFYIYGQSDFWVS